MKVLSQPRRSASLSLLMVAHSVARAFQLRATSTVVLAVGTSLFLLSDVLLSLNPFGYPIPAPRVLILPPCFTAQWMIAISLSVRAAKVHG